MSFEPQKFFIGLVDFFSILMPGAILAYLGKDWASTTFPNLFSFHPEGVEGPAVFFFSSYLLGHFLFLMGSLLDDLVYEPVRNATGPKQVARLLLGKKLSAKSLRWLARVCFKKQTDQAVDRVVALKTDCLSKIGNAEVVNAFQWCKARLTMEQPGALAIVNRFEADSKFFRSFVPVLAGLFLFTAGHAIYRLVITAPSAPSDGWLIVGSALLLLLAFWRYMEQRFKATQQAYWFVLTMEANQIAKNQSFQPSPVLSKTVSRADGLTHAGGVVARQHNGAREYLLVQAKNNPSEWVLPKGHIEPEEDPRHCAIREVHEETGVWARIARPLKVNEYTVLNESVKVQFYLMDAVDEDKAEDPERKTEWLCLEEALERTKPIEQTYELFRQLQREAQ